MDITKHNEKVWDEYLNNDYGNYKNGYSKSDRDTMNIILFGINGVEDKRVLDLGVGTGRSTEMLLSQSKEYLATDYSPSGITICKNKFPDGEFMVNDFTKGIPFDDNSYDFVFLSFNGIDYCTKEEREFVLDEMFRVSTKWICYSTHDLYSILENHRWNKSYIGLQDKMKLIREKDFCFLQHEKESGLVTYFEKSDYTIKYLKEKYKIKELRVVPNLIWQAFNYFLIEKET